MAGTSTFCIDETSLGARHTVAPVGELDSGTYPALVEAFERAAGEGGELHLDLSRLAFIDSAGLRAIIELERSARERRLTLVVTPPPAPLTELLDLTGLTGRMTLTKHSPARPESRPFIERIEVDLPPELSAPRRARVEVRQAAGALLDEPTLDAAILLTSELVTNAVIHPARRNGGDGVRLRITCYAAAVRCEISDDGSGFDPANLGNRAPEAGGRGLFLVDALASRWGTNRVDGGDRFCVWFELEAPPAS